MEEDLFELNRRFSHTFEISQGKQLLVYII